MKNSRDFDENIVIKKIKNQKKTKTFYNDHKKTWKKAPKIHPEKNSKSASNQLLQKPLQKNM